MLIQIAGFSFQTVIANRMMAGRGELEDQPKNERGEEHGQGTGQVDPVKCSTRKDKVTTPEVDKKILGKQIKENGDAC